MHWRYLEPSIALRLCKIDKSEEGVGSALLVEGHALLDLVIAIISVDKEV